MNLYGTHADIAALNAHVAEGYINRRAHPTETDVYIYNYSVLAQYGKIWDDHTLQARGLMVRGTDGLILGRPLPKFFNYEELENAGFKLPWDKPFKVTSKADGSMFLVSGPYSATRGSFDSVQAVWGREVLNKMNVNFDPNISYIFELIHPNNRIVIDYHGDHKLILLAMLDTATGQELPLDDTLGFELIQSHDVPYGESPAESLAALNTPNEEGFVVKFYDNSRVKIKFDEYKRIHRIVTGVSSKTVWDNLRNGKSFIELLERVPDEFNDFVKKTISELTNDYQILWKDGQDLYEAARLLPTRREQAEYIVAQKRLGEFIAFKLLDAQRKPITCSMLEHTCKEDTLGNRHCLVAKVWKHCEPTFRQPFSNREEA